MPDSSPAHLNPGPCYHQWNTKTITMGNNSTGSDTWGGAHIKYLAGWEKLFFQSVLVIEKWFNKEMIITKNDTKVEIFVLQIAIKSHSRSSPAGIMVCLWHVLLCLVHRTMCLNTWSTDSDTVLGGCGSLLVHVSWLMNKSHSGIASADSPALVVKMRVAWSP